jgi:hypothetical protein
MVDSRVLGTFLKCVEEKALCLFEIVLTQCIETELVGLLGIGLGRALECQECQECGDHSPLP